MIVIIKIATIEIVFIITDTVEVGALSIGSGPQLVLLLRLHPEQKKKQIKRVRTGIIMIDYT